MGVPTISDLIQDNELVKRNDIGTDKQEILVNLVVAVTLAKISNFKTNGIRKKSLRGQPTVQSMWDSITGQVHHNTVLTKWRVDKLTKMTETIHKKYLSSGARDVDIKNWVTLYTDIFNETVYKPVIAKAAILGLEIKYDSENEYDSEIEYDLDKKNAWSGTSYAFPLSTEITRE